MKLENLLDKLIDPFVPPAEKERIKTQILKEYNKREREDEEIALEVLSMIKEKRCVYPSELQYELEVGKVKILRLLRKLQQNGYIERLLIKENNDIPPELKARISELWRQGIRGAKMFSLMKFYRLTEKGEEALNSGRVKLL